ncbi:hypothetical protein STEG23_022523, partial [Scotinomys teguina]
MGERRSGESGAVWSGEDASQPWRRQDVEVTGVTSSRWRPKHSRICKGRNPFQALSGSVEETPQSQSQLSLEVPPPLMFPVTVTPLGRDQDCNLKNREPWFLDPRRWGKAAAVGLYFIFPGICTLSLSCCGHMLWDNAFVHWFYKTLIACTACTVCIASDTMKAVVK